MKIIQITHKFGPGSVAYLVHSIHNHLNNNGYDSIWIGFSNPNNISLSKNEISLNLKSAKNPISIFKLRKVIKKILFEDPEIVIHTHLTWPFFYSILATSGLNCKIIHTEHNTYNKRRKIKFIKYIERLFYKKCDKIVCISDGTRNSLARWIGVNFSSMRLLTIYNGSRIFDSKNQNIEFKNPLNIVTIGSLTTQKGVDTAIDGINLARGIINKYRIVGKGPLAKPLKDKVNRLNLKDKVEFVGWVDDVETELKNADIFLMPSNWEGFGLAAVEAMSVGLPGIVSGVDGLNEVVAGVNKGIYTVPPGDSKAIANGIQYLYESREHFPDMAKEVRQQALQFSIPSMVRKYESVYCNLIK